MPIDTSIFPDFADIFWQRLDPYFVARENLVSKIHLLETLEQLSPYRGNSEPYFRRIWRSLDQLSAHPGMKADWLNAALLVFANAIYLPQSLLEDAWRNLFLEFKERELESSVVSLADGHIHIFENDPSGMAADFCHLNALHGRLDNDKYARVPGTDALADLLLDFAHAKKALTAVKTFQQLCEKRYWILLVDKSLSGHSLSGDVERLLRTQEIVLAAGRTPPKIVILCQVLTEGAMGILDSIVAKTREVNPSLPSVAIYSALSLSHRYKIHSDDNHLVYDPGAVQNIRELCNWFAETLIVPDPEFKRMRERSGDNLAFGYRQCGLTIVDFENCPTDSLPLLWFASSNDTALPYSGPFPRVHSRIGGQRNEPSADKWKAIADGEIQARIVASLHR